MANVGSWKGSLMGATEPLIVKGLIQAASTESFSKGECLVYNETSNNWIGISAAADAMTYLIGFAAHEINTLNATAARYMEIIVPRPGDLFEIELAAAASIALGANYVPTGTTPTTATADVDGYPVFISAGDSNYPLCDKYGGTTVSSVSHGLFTVNPDFSYYKKIAPSSGHYQKVLTLTASTTLLEEWTGAVVCNTGATGAVTHELPQNCRIGTNFEFAVGTAQELRLHSTGGGIIIKGGKQADSKYISITDEGDFVKLVAVGSNDWLAVNSISGADADISVET